jgi:BTB/POZ domain-containing protein KCTD9
MLYRASRDGWTAKDFHSKCDGKGPTLSLFSYGKNDIIGGFTMAQWSSPSVPEFKKDKSAFIFELENGYIF